jgi:hypothetical protein
MTADAPPVPPTLSRHAIWLAVARAAFGAPSVAAPEACLRLLGLSCGRRPNPARYFVGFFGVRELALAALLLGARRDLRKLRALVGLGALADMGDSALVLGHLLRARRIEPAALTLLGTGLSGSAASVAVWLEVQRAEGENVTAS